MGGQTKGETMGYEYPVRIGAGVNSVAMHAERVNGTNPLAVAEATARKKQLLLDKKGPVLLETTVYRQSRHSQSDSSTYRTEEEVQSFLEIDCIKMFEMQLCEHGVITQNEIKDIRKKVIDKITRTVELAVDTSISPREEATFIERVMFSNRREDARLSTTPNVLLPMEENPRIKQIARQKRYGYDQEGNNHYSTKVYAIRDAIFEAMIYRFYEDPTMIAYGEENRDWGGAYACYRGLTEALPYYRLFNSPISEGAIVGTG